MALVNAEPLCAANFCTGLYAQSSDEAVIMNELGNFDILVILNADNSSPPLSATNKALVETALTNGSLHGLMVYDRFVSNTNDNSGVGPNIPGLESCECLLLIAFLIRSLSQYTSLSLP